MSHPPPKPYCLRCGEPKPPGRGRKFCDPCREQYEIEKDGRRCIQCGERSRPRQRYCDACQELAKWKRRRRAQLKRRVGCLICGNAKGPGRGRRFCRACEETRAPVMMCLRCGLRPRVRPIDRLCTVCAEGTVVRRRARQTAWQRRNRQIRGKERRTAKRRRREAETYQMNKRLTAERAGEPIGALTDDEYVRVFGTGRGHLQPHVSVEPLMPYMRDVFDLDALADSTGLSHSFLNRIARGLYERLAVPDADRIAVAFDIPFTLLYPDA